jgi:hypothetical protein
MQQLAMMAHTAWKPTRPLIWPMLLQLLHALNCLMLLPKKATQLFRPSLCKTVLMTIAFRV